MTRRRIDPAALVDDLRRFACFASTKVWACDWHLHALRDAADLIEKHAGIARIGITGGPLPAHRTQRPIKT